MLPDLYYCVQTSYVFETRTVSASSTAVLTEVSTTTSASASASSSATTSTASESKSESSTSTSTSTSTLTTFTTAATPIAVPETTTSSASISTPSPIQTGMVSDCTTFYLVVSGDSCAAIAASYNISLADFYAWNPAVGDTCSSLWADDYVCVGVVGVAVTSLTAVTTATITTTATSSSGATTPTPYESGIVDGCDAFHLVVSGDDCEAIAGEAGITLEEFYEWNPTVGETCSALWVDYYVCVGLSE